MNARSLPPPEDWVAGDERLSRLGREELKLFLGAREWEEIRGRQSWSGSFWSI